MIEKSQLPGLVFLQRPCTRLLLAGTGASGIPAFFSQCLSRCGRKGCAAATGGISMIKGIGVDLVDVKRMAKSLAREGFKEKVFTEDEISYCEAKKAHAAESYAARYAAKEAIGKAMGCGVTPGCLREIETLPDEAGVPQMHLRGSMLRRALNWNAGAIFVSLSHTDSCAVAQVIVEARFR